MIELKINDCLYRINPAEPLDISIPLDFAGAQPNAYGVERATSAPVAAGELVGDTRRGGSCNFEQIKLISHCNGTHTESVGHLTHERISVHDCLRDVFIRANLISVEPQRAADADDTYAVDLPSNDFLITRRSIEDALRASNQKSKVKNQKFEALIVRTLPNSANKKSRVYLNDVPPFFSSEAMEFIVECGVRHLLADVPSIDRIFDEGKLANHRRFWQMTEGTFEANPETLNQTVTEMIFAPDEIADGAYLLNLQIAPFVADASPSRPRLFKLLAARAAA